MVHYIKTTDIRKFSLVPFCLQTTNACLSTQGSTKHPVWINTPVLGGKISYKPPDRVVILLETPRTLRSSWKLVEKGIFFISCGGLLENHKVIWLYGFFFTFANELYFKGIVWSIFLTAIWLSHHQLWAIIKGAASLTWC